MHSLGDILSINSVAVFRDPNNKDRFVLIAAIDTYYYIVVRCNEKEHEKIQNYLLEQVNTCDECAQEDPFKDLKMITTRNAMAIKEYWNG